MIVVGITGYKRSGKGEVGKMLADSYPGVVHQLGVSDKVKQLAALTLGLEGTPEELIELMDEAKLGLKDGGWEVGAVTVNPSTHPLFKVTGRQLLQNMGTQGRNLLGDSVWVDQVLPSALSGALPRAQGAIDADLRARYPNVDCVAFTDLRFPNEAERIKAVGGVVWNVHRPGAKTDGHASEQGLPASLIDWEIYNSRDLSYLREEVQQAILETLN